MQVKAGRPGGVLTEHGGGDPVGLLMTGEQTQGRFALVETVVRRTQEPPLHSHTREDELVYVLSGEVTFYVDGNRLERSAGSCVLLSKGHEHTYCVESGEARLLVLLMPAGLEGYYREVGEYSDAELYIEQLIAVSARYGVEITGPGPQQGRVSGLDPTYHTGGDASGRQQ